MPRYGNHDLKIGDKDNASIPENPTWGGIRMPPQTFHAVATNTEDTLQMNLFNQIILPRYVYQLQYDLRELGFLIVPEPNGEFDLHTEWGIREFQIYAKMNYVAQEDISFSTSPRSYLERLSQVPTDTHRYQGPVSGVANEDIRRAIQHWLDHHWRCPVIIQARMGPEYGTIFNGHENIWHHDEVINRVPRMLARDFSNHYTFPDGRDQNSMITLGYGARHMNHEGPCSKAPNHTWAEAELLPENLIGLPLNQLTNAQRSTYKVIRAVSEVECFGFFDCVNAYDNAFVSLGPCHWTLGLQGRDPETGLPETGEGELCGYLSYLRHIDGDAYDALMTFFGAGIDEDWVNANGIANGQNLRMSSLRKYEGWPSLMQENNDFIRMAKDEAHGNYFKTWHWFYRFVMAGRTNSGYQRRMWDMARVRIRDIRDVPWIMPDDTINDFNTERNIQFNFNNITIGDIFTSERSMGIIMRWHIRSPSRIIRNGEPGTHLLNAFIHAVESTDPQIWRNLETMDDMDNEHEEALLEGLMNEARSSTNFRTLNAVNEWPDWSERDNPRGYTLDNTIAENGLDNTNGSFNFDNGNLPLAPNW